MRNEILQIAEMIKKIASQTYDAPAIRAQCIAQATTVKKSVGARQLNWFGLYAPHKDIELLTGYKHFGHFVNETDKPGFIYYLDENDKPLLIERYDDYPGPKKHTLLDYSIFKYINDEILILFFTKEDRLAKVIKCCITAQGQLDYYLEGNIDRNNHDVFFFKWKYDYIDEQNVEILELKYSEWLKIFRGKKYYVVNRKISNACSIEIE